MKFCRTSLGSPVVPEVGISTAKLSALTDMPGPSRTRCPPLAIWTLAPATRVIAPRSSTSSTPIRCAATIAASKVATERAVTATRLPGGNPG